MKRITTVLSLILLLALLLSSCNMDSNTGLFQEAGQSERKVNYTIYSVLAKISEKEYLVSSTDGVFVFNVNANNENAEKYLRGKDATQVLFAKAVGASWKFVYYNTDDNTYYQVTSENTTPVEYTNIDSKYKFSSSYTNLNGEYALVFKDSEGKNYVYYGTYPTATFEPTKTEFEDVSYAGNGYFIGTKEKVRYIFKMDDLAGKSINGNTVSVISSDNCYILKDGKIMIGKENKNSSSDSITVGSSSSVVSYTEGGKTYIILPSTNNVFIYDGGTNLEMKDCAGLKNIEVKAILGVKDDSLNVITATSAAKSLNLKDGLITDWV